MVILIDTYKSFANKLRELHNLPKFMADDQIMSWVYHSFIKQPPKHIESVKRSSLLSQYSLEIQQALDELEQDALQGCLNKYVTKEAKRLNGKHDRLLYRSAIWHFHILPQSGCQIHSSKHLVFAYIWRDILYLLDIGSHQKGEFNQDNYYLELINKEWPEVLPLEDIAVDNLPLGGGVEPTGESSLIAEYYRNIKKFTSYADSLLSNYEETLKLELIKLHYPIPKCVNLDLIDYDRSIKKGRYPSYAFFYEITGTPFFIHCDLINKKNNVHLLT